MRIGLALLALVLLAGCGGSSDATEPPSPPQLPQNFLWDGRWVVRDLDVDVPFTWRGKDGNMQMIAGGEQYPIHFTNLIYDRKLYTLTYKWPGTVPPLPDDDCVCLGEFTLDELNRCLASSRYVGAETLKEEAPRKVNHFRISAVFGDPTPKPNAFRVPIMEGDFYVDRQDPDKLWKVLQFGWQNVLDPALDEWAVMQTHHDTAGEVTLPAVCKGKCKDDRPAFPAGFYCR